MTYKKSCKKWLCVFWDKHYDDFQMHTITTHLDKAHLTTSSELLSLLQGPGLLFSSWAFWNFLFLIPIRQSVWKALDWTPFKREKGRSYNFDVLKNLGMVFTNLWPEYSHFFSFLHWGNSYDSLSSNFDSEVAYFLVYHLYLYPSHYKKVLEESQASNREALWGQELCSFTRTPTSWPGHQWCGRPCSGSETGFPLFSTPKGESTWQVLIPSLVYHYFTPLLYSMRKMSPWASGLWAMAYTISYFWSIYPWELF